MADRLRVYLLDGPCAAADHAPALLIRSWRFRPVWLRRPAKALPFDVVNFSTGFGSYLAAKRVAARARRLVLLQCDTNVEHPDNYRFGFEAAGRLADTNPLCEVVLVVLGNRGRTPMDVAYKDTGWFLPNSQRGICSDELKAEPAAAWLAEYGTPLRTRVAIGFDGSEPARLERIQARRAPWTYHAPLCAEEAMSSREAKRREVEADGLRGPVMYAMGYPHANCGEVVCHRAGMKIHRLALTVAPHTYVRQERDERQFRVVLWAERVAAFCRRWFGWALTRMDVLAQCAELGTEPGQIDVSILRDRSGGEPRPMTLTEFREREEARAADEAERAAVDAAARPLDLFDLMNDDCGGSCMFAEPEGPALVQLTRAA